jgi:hypothetical protein
MIYQELHNSQAVPVAGQTLYHGSVDKVTAIDFSKSVEGKDFGRGFYTTSSRDQAVKFSLIKTKRINSKSGFVSVFQYIHNPEMRIKKFEKADTDWLLFVLKNRGYANEQANVLEKSFDIVIGPVANDAVGLVLNQLLIGTYGDPLSPEARDIAVRLLDTTRLHNQVFFGTERAVSCLQFLEAFEIGIN